MKGEFSFRQICSVFRKEYVQWITNPRIVVCAMLLVMIREIAVLPMKNVAMQIDQPLNVLEPVIAVANSGSLLLLIPLVYLVIIADFPSLDGNTYFYLMRTGRLNWIFGQIMFQIGSLVTYLLLIIAFTAIQVSSISFLANGWSPATNSLGNESLELLMQQLLPLNLHYQMSPYMAFGMSYLLVFLFLSLCSGLMLLSSLYGKKTIAFWGIMVNVAAGIILCAIKSKWMWLFPVSHSITWLHYQDYYRDYVLSPWLSISLLVVLNAGVFLTILHKAGTVNLDILREVHE